VGRHDALAQEGANVGRRRVIVTPSEVHEFAYCPRLYFFSVHVGRERSLRERLRLLVGRIYHLVFSLRDRAAGRSVEESIEVELGGGVVVRGRPDAYSVEDDRLLVVERKSSRPPRRGAWLSDAAQASVYALMLSVLYGAREARIRVEYPGASRETVLDSDRVALVSRLIDDLVLVKVHGVVPWAARSARKCSRCPFRRECELLDSERVEGELYEPGSWLAGLTVDRGFGEPG